MLSGLRIENFKGISEQVYFDLKPITLLFGANSAGKSTIIHALHYARELFERGNVDADETISGGEYVTLGGFENFVHGHDKSKAIKIGFEFFLNQSTLPRYDNQTPEYMMGSKDEFKLFEEPEYIFVELEIEWHSEIQMPYISNYTVSMNGDFVSICQAEAPNGKVWISINPFHPLLKPIERTVLDGVSGISLQKYRTDPDATSMLAILDFSHREKRIQGLDVWYPEDKIDLYAGKEIFSECLFQLSRESKNGALLDFEDPFNFHISWGINKNDDFDEIMYIEETLNDALSSLILGPSKLLREFLQEFRYLGPLRKSPMRNYLPTKQIEDSRWPSGLAAWDSLYLGSDDLVESVSDWLGGDNKFNSGCRVKRTKFLKLNCDDPIVEKILSGERIEKNLDGHVLPKHLSREVKVVLIAGEDQIELQPQDVGTGISQILPVVVIALSAEKKIVAIEQPELHVHPKIEAEIASLFAHSAIENNSFFIIETHSEHMVLRLQKLIRLGDLCPEDVSIQYVSNGSNGVKVKSLGLDDEGDFIDEWPGGFFPERLNELR